LKFVPCRKGVPGRRWFGNGPIAHGSRAGRQSRHHSEEEGIVADERVGNATDETTDIGPLVSREQLERVLGYLSVGADEGARAVAGGGRATGAELHRGFFVEPTVLADVDDAMRVAQEEIFGPVLSVLPFDDIDEVIRRANHTSYGLASAVWTTDLRTAHRVAHALAAGTVWINAYNVVDPAMPFGGYKMSGWGRELSQHALDEYTELKSVCMSLG
jgi:aldehyde dehydrogenase (NAD+)